MASIVAPSTTSADTPASSSSAPSTAALKSLGSGFTGDPMSKYGTHECTCDGCNARPIVGFRYKCTKCKDHDICENCYAQFQNGTLPHVNKLNPVSKDVNAHAFAAFVDGKQFSAMAGAKKPTTKIATAKVKPNDPCTCGSGKKYKKCCWNLPK